MRLKFFKYLATFINLIFLIILLCINPWYALVGMIGTFVGMLICLCGLCHIIAWYIPEEIDEIFKEIRQKFDEFYTKYSQ